MDKIEYSSACELLDALQRRVISSRELLEYYFSRIEKYDVNSINSIVYLDIERAMQQAEAADAARMKGENWGKLHGLPMTVKELIEVKNFPWIEGDSGNVGRIGEVNSPTIEALIQEGAIIFGLSNSPQYGRDVQTYNDVYGITSNPWDLTKTPGGSSGGSAAALAADLTSLELGSDIGGSIRTPAHYCGVYGHKPTLGLIPKIKPLPSRQIQDDLSVVCPLSRSANDLELALSVMAGPEYHHSQAWQLDLPNPRHTSLSDYRVAAWLDDPFFPVDDAVSKRLKMTVEALRSNGIAVDEMARPAIGNFEEVYRIYFSLLMSGTGLEMPHEYLLDLGIREDALGLEQLDIGANRFRSAAVRHRDWLILNQRRHQIRAEWNNFFSEFDIMLMPVTSITAPEHNPIRAAQNDALPIKDSRKILVNGEERSYWEQLGWISMATMAHLPATVAPIGCSESGLPVGIQIIGPYLGDRTTIDFAQKLSELIGGFIPPIPLSNM